MEVRVPSPKKRVAVYAHVVSKPLDDLWLVQQVEPLKRFVEAHGNGIRFTPTPASWSASPDRRLKHCFKIVMQATSI